MSNQQVDRKPSGQHQQESLATTRLRTLLERAEEDLTERMGELVDRYPDTYQPFFRAGAQFVDMPDGQYGKIITAIALKLRGDCLDRLNSNKRCQAEINNFHPITITLELSGDEYQLTVNLEGHEPEVGSPDSFSCYEIRCRHGHVFFESKRVGGSDLPNLLESLASLDDAIPYFGLSDFNPGYEPRYAQQVYLVIAKSLGGFGNLINLAVRTYNILEIRGTSWEDQCASAERYLSTAPDAREAAMRKGVIEYRAAIEMNQELSMSLGLPKVTIKGIKKLLDSGAPGEWKILQHKAHGEFNGVPAYVFVRRRTVQAAFVKEPCFLGVGLRRIEKGQVYKDSDDYPSSTEGYLEFLASKDAPLHIPLDKWSELAHLKDEVGTEQ